MEITAKNLASFHAWLVRRGRSEGTADLYVKNVRACGETKTITTRLIEGELAPLTKRTNKAALVAWATFTKDGDLHADVKEIRLPPAQRVAIKVPLPTADWQRVVLRLEDVECDLDDRVRHVCLVIAKRGLRVSDALRIRRTEVVTALKSGVLSYEGKGSKRHEISAAALQGELEALATFKDWDRLRDLVSRGKHPSAASNRIRRVIDQVCEELEIDDVYPHRFRRTYATHYLEEHRGDPRAIIKLQKHMGWASMNTAAMYADSVDHDELAATGDKMSGRIFAKK